MRRVILKMHSSLDGFVLGPGEDLEWAFATFDDEMAEWEVAGLREAGRRDGPRHPRGDEPHWPTSTEPYAPPMNEIPKVVFSRTLERAEWAEATIARGTPAEDLAALRAQPGKDILVHGGPRFARALIPDDLIDEYRLVVHPVALGDGEPLFRLRRNLRRVAATPFPAGAVALVMERA